MQIVRIKHRRGSDAEGTLGRSAAKPERAQDDRQGTRAVESGKEGTRSTIQSGAAHTTASSRLRQSSRGIIEQYGLVSVLGLASPVSLIGTSVSLLDLRAISHISSVRHLLFYWTHQHNAASFGKQIPTRSTPPNKQRQGSKTRLTLCIERARRLIFGLDSFHGSYTKELHRLKQNSARRLLPTTRSSRPERLQCNGNGERTSVTNLNERINHNGVESTPEEQG
jgi:hypothetical protein